MGISIRSSGNYNKTEAHLGKLRKVISDNCLRKYGERGVAELENATPKDTGLTANSWSYRIERSPDRITLAFYNSNTVDYVNVAIILQYGHATRNGGWVEGIDYINPAIASVFKDMSNELWSEVSAN